MKMENIRYEIKFYTYWHCGSGLAAGADVDLLPVKDRQGLPYVPGKTIKGLVRDAAETICELQGLKVDLNECFGFFDDKDGKRQGLTFFSNAVLDEPDRRYVVASKSQEYLYKSMASTAIGADGVAKEHSLRKMEVVVPCTLVGEIRNVPDGCADVVRKSLGYVKRLGQSRTRGLGRCDIMVKEGDSL